ncbi:hypothetical protein KY289_023795 [Solanum tuberosum]|nr:hypothetical protein KY289_023795 [Solanum tuberosum]
MGKKHKRGVGKRVVYWLRELEHELDGRMAKRMDYGFGGEIWGFFCHPLEWRRGWSGGFGCETWGLFVFTGVVKRMDGGFGCEIWGFLCVHRSGEQDGMGF